MRKNPTLTNVIWTALLVSLLCGTVYLRHGDARPADLQDVGHNHGG